jgi:putative FmdB family regulatory protein
MPIYEYQCPKCGVVEVMQRITEDPLKRCPNCKSKVERIMSRSSFILKGSGWYATDYGRAGKGDSESGSSASAESSGKGTQAASPSTDSSDSSAKSTDSSGKSGDSSGKASGGATDKAAPKADKAASKGQD